MNPWTRSLSMLAIAGTALTAIAAAPAFTAPDGLTQPDVLPFDLEVDCEQFVPRQEPGVSGITDGGDDVRLDVLVLIDTEQTLAIAEQLRDAETEEEHAAAEAAFEALVAEVEPLIAPGDQSYAALDISYDLDFDLYLPFEDDGTPRDRATEDARQSQLIIDGAKDQMGGVRPEGTDVVYVVTDLDIFAPGIGDAVAGQADCIGGVEWPEHAFAVGEIPYYADLALGPILFYREATAKIMGHEIGHLMGAHHHYQTCGPHAVGETLAGGFGACSLMTNAVDFTTYEFSVLNGGIIRANAVEWAHDEAGHSH